MIQTWEKVQEDVNEVSKSQNFQKLFGKPINIEMPPDVDYQVSVLLENLITRH